MIGPAQFVGHFHDGEPFTIDIAWTYLDPLHEAAAVKDHCASTPSAPTW